MLYTTVTETMTELDDEQLRRSDQWLPTMEFIKVEEFHNDDEQITRPHARSTAADGKTPVESEHTLHMGPSRSESSSSVMVFSG